MVELLVTGSILAVLLFGLATVSRIVTQWWFIVLTIIFAVIAFVFLY